jgi:DNA-binding NarL/FixJ family response regulator
MEPGTLASSGAAPLPAGSVKHIRVVVVDDQRLLRESIAKMLEADPRIHVLGLGATGQEAIELGETLEPDIMLMDIRMPVLDGIQAIREIKARSPGIRIIILTAFQQDGYVLEGLLAGADGYLLKDLPPETLVSSLVAVASGEEVIEPAIIHQVTQLMGKANTKRKIQYDGLSARELQVLAMVARGMVAKEIARDLRISEKTVRNHISNIYAKLNVFDRSQVILYAFKKGIVEPE